MEHLTGLDLSTVLFFIVFGIILCVVFCWMNGKRKIIRCLGYFGIDSVDLVRDPDPAAHAERFGRKIEEKIYLTAVRGLRLLEKMRPWGPEQHKVADVLECCRTLTMVRDDRSLQVCIGRLGPFLRDDISDEILAAEWSHFLTEWNDLYDRCWHEAPLIIKGGIHFLTARPVNL